MHGLYLPTTIHRMKIRLLALSLLCSFTSFGKGKAAAIDKGYYTLSATWGFPNMGENIYGPSREFGPISISADRQLTKRFSVGLQYSYCRSTSDRFAYTNANIGTIKNFNGYFEQRSSYQSLSAGVEYCYVNRGRLWMACGIAIARIVPKHDVLYLIDSNNVDHSNELYIMRSPEIHLRYSVTNVRYNLGENIGLCAGVGWGLNGIFTVGALYKFTGRK